MKFRNRKPVVDHPWRAKIFSNRKILFEFLFRRKGFVFFWTQCILFKTNFSIAFSGNKKLFIHALHTCAHLVWVVTIPVLVDEFLERFYSKRLSAFRFGFSIQLLLKRIKCNEPCGHSQCKISYRNIVLADAPIDLVTLNENNRIKWSVSAWQVKYH